MRIESCSWQDFGMLLRQHRRDAGLTQEDLAERAGISVYSISNMERGIRHIPRRDTVDHIAQALSLSADDARALAEAARRVTRASSTRMSHSLREHTPNRIPHPSTRLFGRADDLRHITELMLDGETRLLTIAGPPGVGKTRLAFALADALSGTFPDGIACVLLTSESDPARVLPSIAESLGVRETGAAPLKALLRDHLRTKRLLLVLDNFEHVAAAAPELAELLGACPQLSIVVTSRATLHLSGEHVHVLSPLPIPAAGDTVYSLDELAEIDAVALFLDRAQTIRPTLRITTENAGVIAAICRRLDGLPLALELAAARLNMLSLQALAARLAQSLGLLADGPRDVPAHQRALRATLTWSYDLLPTSAQAMLRRLSVFKGGCTLDAVEEVGAMAQELPLEEVAYLEDLGQLVDHHLVMCENLDDTVRINVLEAIGEYGGECLKAAGEHDELSRAHAAYYLQFAESAAQHYFGTEESVALDQLEGERHNLRAALHWAIENHQEKCALEIANALTRFWAIRGSARESLAWIGEILACGVEPATADILLLRARALQTAGSAATRLGEYVVALDYHQQSLVLYREVGEREDVGMLLNSLGVVSNHLGQFERAEEYLSEALSYLNQPEQQVRRSQVLNNLGISAMEQSDFSKAQRYYSECRDLCVQAHNVGGMATSSTNLGLLCMHRGQYETARSWFEASLQCYIELQHRQGIALLRLNLGENEFLAGDDVRAAELWNECLSGFRDVGDQRGEALTLGMLGALALREDRLQEAASLLQESLDLARRQHDLRNQSDCLRRLGGVHAKSGKTDEAATLYCAALQMSQQIKHRRGVAACLEGLSMVRWAQRRPGHAATLAGAAQTLRATMGSPLPPAQRTEIDGLVRELRASLDAQTFATSWAAGADALLDAVVAAELRDPPGASPLTVEDLTTFSPESQSAPA